MATIAPVACSFFTTSAFLQQRIGFEVNPDLSCNGCSGVVIVTCHHDDLYAILLQLLYSLCCLVFDGIGNCDEADKTTTRGDEDDGLTFALQCLRLTARAIR
jgi:hypothetical protein